MYNVIRNEDGSAAGGGAMTAASPLADVVACVEIPEVYGSLEPSVDRQLRLSQVLDGRFLVREIYSRGGMATIYRAEDKIGRAHV